MARERRELNGTATMESRMNLSRFALAALLASAGTLACNDTTDESSLTAHPVPTDTPANVTPPPQTPPRTLVSGTQMATSPVNLIVDPGFGLVGQQAGYGSFLSLYDGTFSPVDITTTFDSRAPSGFGGSTAVVKAENATDKRSDAIVLLTSFLGGTGPFHAQVWVSKSDVKGTPVALTVDAKGITASITDGTPDGEAFDLAPVPDAQRTAGARTWTLLRGTVTKALPYGGFFLVRTGTGGGQFLVAAPEITAQPLLDGLPVHSFGSTRPAVARPSTASERAAIAKYKAIPPRLVPASAGRPERALRTP